MSKKKGATVIAVANNKGGVGKTTTACNLAYALSRKLITPEGKIEGQVLLVDLDPQGHVAAFFGVRQHVYDDRTNRNGKCISFLLEGRASLSESIVPLDRKDDQLRRPNLFLIPASRRLEAVTEQLILADYTASRHASDDHIPLDRVLSGRLEIAMNMARYIILDCPPKLDILKNAVYEMAQWVIVPTKLDAISIEGTVQHTVDLDRVRQAKGARAQVAYILPTMVQARQVMDKQMALSLIKTYGRSRIASPVPLAVAVKESPGSGGRTLFEYELESPTAQAAAAAYEDLANKVWAYG